MAKSKEEMKKETQERIIGNIDQLFFGCKDILDFSIKGAGQHEAILYDQIKKDLFDLGFGG